MTRSLVVLGAMLLATAPARADVPFDLGITVKGGVTFSGLTKPDTKSFGGQPYDITYPGFFGAGGAVGLFLEPRVFDMLGLEIGIYWEQASGKGDINDYNVELTTNDVVIPLHVRFTTPGEGAHFVLGLGPDFLVHTSSRLDKDPHILQPLEAQDREQSVGLGFQLGVIVDAGPLRIPLELRGRWIPIDDTYDPRVAAEGGDVTGYKPSWELQGAIFLGLTYDLDLL